MMRPSRANCSLTTEFALVQENILLQNERITQQYVIQSEQNPFLWFGVLFIDDGIFKGAVMRLTIFIEETYPDCSCPKVVFDPVPYHPLVNPSTGELDTRNAFPDWNSNKRRLFELLLFVKRVIRQADEYITQIGSLLREASKHKQIAKQLLVNDTLGESSHHATSIRSQQIQSTLDPSEKVVLRNSSLTRDCRIDNFDSSVKDLFSWFHHTLDFYKTYDNEPDKFFKLLEVFKDKCYQQLLDRPALCGDDGNAIVFSPWNSDIHEPLRTCVLAGRFAPASLFASYHKETDSVSFIPGHDNSNTN